jgi:hypothetical protein
MANLLGQNIGTNYKGFLNLGSTINTPLDTTLRSVTDGDGNSSPLRLSTTSFRLQNSTGFTGPFLNWRVLDNNSFWLDFRGFNDSGGTYSIFATDRLIIGRNPGLAGFDSATLGLSQTGIFIGGASNGYASARLHVSGDGTNPIALFETTGAGSTLRIDNSQLRFGGSVAFGSLAYAMSGTTFSGNNNGLGLGFYSQNGLALDSSRFDFGFGGDAVANTAGTVSHLALVRNFAAGAGSANYRPLSILYTINNSGAQTGTATGIFLNATETALNGMGHNLMDLQRGGVSQFLVSRTGVLTTASSINCGLNMSVAAGGAYIISSRGFLGAAADGVWTLYDSSAGSFGRLQFGGTTNAFPAIKRNGAAIDFRLADDSGYVPITAGNDSRMIGLFRVLDSAGNNSGLFYADGYIDEAMFYWNGKVGIGAFVTDASVKFQIDSTTRGFLPPRMTTTQINAIATPAEGLVVFNTTIGHLCVRAAGVWHKLSQSTM